jgi:hypothetical protein
MAGGPVLGEEKWNVGMSAVLKSRSKRLALAARVWRLHIDLLELNTTCAGSLKWSDQLHHESGKAGSPRAFRRLRSVEHSPANEKGIGKSLTPFQSPPLSFANGSIDIL